MIGWSDTVISQYANSPTLLALLSTFNDAVDPSDVFDQFFAMVMDLDTAEGYGLDVWGRIVGISRILQLPAAEYFTFNEAGDPNGNTYGQAIWYGGNLSTTAYVLTDDAFRQVIYAKAFANICDCSTESINRVLMTVFAGRGNVYVRDNLNMTMSYVFPFALDPVSVGLINAGILPRPAGVLAGIIQTSYMQTESGQTITTESGQGLQA